MDLHSAVQLGKLEKVKKLIASGMDVNKKDDTLEYTALHLAVKKKNIDIIKELVKAGANVNAVNVQCLGETPLFIAVMDENPSLKVVEELLNSGADPNYATRSSGTSVLHIAVSPDPGFEENKNNKKDIVKIIEKLIEKGADLNAQNYFGKTPLMTAAEREEKTLMKILLEAGADPFIQNIRGNTVLYYIGKNKELQAVVAPYFRKRNFNESLLKLPLTTNILAKVANYNTPGTGKLIHEAELKEQQNANAMPPLEPIPIPIPRKENVSHMENVDGGRRRKRKTRRSKRKTNKTRKH